MTSAIARIDRLGRVAALSCIAALLGIALQVDGAGAQPPAGRHGPHALAHASFLERYADRLSLDEDTRATIRGVVNVTRSSTERRRVERKALFGRMEEMLAADQPDEPEVLLLVDQLGKLDLADHKDRMVAMLAIRSVLTPEQRAELLEIRKEPRGHGRVSRLGPCSRDAARLCSEPGRATLRCLDTSWDELSGHCQGMFESVSRPAPRAPGD